MSTRIHTGTPEWISVHYFGTTDALVEFFDDEEMDDVPGPTLVIYDRGNGEAFVIAGTDTELLAVAVKINRALGGHPLAPLGGNPT